MTNRPTLTPGALRDAPALIESVFPAQKVSFEAQTERKAKPSQTLTALGSYWKGRKPLILVRAIVLGTLLPPTDDAEQDLEVFETADGLRRREPGPPCPGRTTPSTSRHCKSSSRSTRPGDATSAPRGWRARHRTCDREAGAVPPCHRHLRQLRREGRRCASGRKKWTPTGSTRRSGRS